MPPQTASLKEGPIGTVMTRFLGCELHRYVQTERHPEPPKHCGALCTLKTSIVGLQKHAFWVVRCTGMCRQSATLNPEGLCCIVQFEDKHSRSPKTRFLGCELHRYVQTERHPEPENPRKGLCCIVHFEDKHGSSPKTTGDQRWGPLLLPSGQLIERPVVCRGTAQQTKAKRS